MLRSSVQMASVRWAFVELAPVEPALAPLTSVDSVPVPRRFGHWSFGPFDFGPSSLDACGFGLSGFGEFAFCLARRLVLQ